MPNQPRFTQVEKFGGVVVLRPEGDLVGGEETEELEELIAELNAGGARGLVLNLKGVDFASTLGLQAVVGAYIKFSKRGARVYVCRLCRRVQHLYDVVHLGALIPRFDSEDEAVTTCATGAATPSS